MSERRFLKWEKPGKALITGASAGIGKCYAKELAGKGFNLILVARRVDRLRKLALELETNYSIHCDIISVDLSNPAEIEQLAEKIRRIDDIDIIINNAGFGTIGYFANIPIKKSMEMFNVHMNAPVQITHAAVNNMLIKGRGAIINVASMAAFIYTPGNLMYDATKSFLTAFSENLWLELGDRGIRIQALCPGFTITEFHEVGDFKNFDRNIIPASIWMTADEVVSLSLDALEKNKNIVFVPGWKNRLYKWLFLHSSILRKMTYKRMKEGLEK